jgi:hypothetical protein
MGGKWQFNFANSKKFRKVVVIDEYYGLPVKINALFSVTPCI